MIGVVGTARVILFDGYSINTLRIDREHLKVNLLTSNEESGECEVKFFITLPSNPNCKSLNDYNSFVHPSLQKHINAIVISTQVVNILPLGIQPIKHISQL